MRHSEGDGPIVFGVMDSLRSIRDKTKDVYNQLLAFQWSNKDVDMNELIDALESMKFDIEEAVGTLEYLKERG